MFTTLLLGDSQFLVAQHELIAISQSFQCQIDERSYPHGLIGTTAVVEEEAGMVGHMSGQQRNQLSRSNVGSRRNAGQLPDGDAGENGAQFEVLVISAKRRRDVMIDNGIVDLDVPGNHAACIG